MFLEFQKVVEQAESEAGLTSLDDVSRRLLYHVARLHDEGQKVCIGDVLNSHKLCAPVTASKRLQILEKDGWVQIASDPTSHLRKLVRLTSKSQNAIVTASRKLKSKVTKLL